MPELSSTVLPAPTCLPLAGGGRIYSWPVRVFGDFKANIYLYVRGEYVALIDTGSGTPQSNADLVAGFAALSGLGEPLTWRQVTRVIITHGHIDHHGGLDFVRTLSAAPVAIHELDRQVITAYQERRVLTSRALRAFLHEAGVAAAQVSTFMAMYGGGKERFQGGEVQTTLHHGDLLDGVFRVIHTPGHCPGQVCLRVSEVLFSADQLLSRTVPHLSAESITPGNGLGHYLHSLDVLEAEQGVALTLGGHEDAMPDLHGRIQAIRDSHNRKLERLLTICQAPRTLHQITQELYPHVKDYNVLLALEKVGALAEYLNARGQLGIANVASMEADEDAPPTYQRTSRVNAFTDEPTRRHATR